MVVVGGGDEVTGQEGQSDQVGTHCYFDWGNAVNGALGVWRLRAGSRACAHGQWAGLCLVPQWPTPPKQRQGSSLATTKGVGGQMAECGVLGQQRQTPADRRGPRRGAPLQSEREGRKSGASGVASILYCDRPAPSRAKERRANRRTFAIALRKGRAKNKGPYPVRKRRLQELWIGDIKNEQDAWPSSRGSADCGGGRLRDRVEFSCRTRRLGALQEGEKGR